MFQKHTHCLFFILTHLMNDRHQEVEFVDDYERPVLEKYEKVTPTPMAKKAKESGPAKVEYDFETIPKAIFEFSFEKRFFASPIALHLFGTIGILLIAMYFKLF